MKIFFRTCWVVLACVAFAPHGVTAARVLLEHVPEGQSGGVTIDAVIVPDSAPLNVVEGIILFQGVTGALSVSVDTTGSVLALWPVTPRYDAAEHTIRFTGGTPESFAAVGRLFRIHISSLEDARVKVAWIGGSAYRADGNGTMEPVASQSLTVQVPKGSDQTPEKTTPPLAPAEVHTSSVPSPYMSVILVLLSLAAASLIIWYGVFIAKKK